MYTEIRKRQIKDFEEGKYKLPMLSSHSTPYHPFREKKDSDAIQRMVKKNIAKLNHERPLILQDFSFS